jgi:hypothetical protein
MGAAPALQQDSLQQDSGTAPGPRGGLWHRPGAPAPQQDSGTAPALSCCRPAQQDSGTMGARTMGASAGLWHRPRGTMGVSAGLWHRPRGSRTLAPPPAGPRGPRAPAPPPGSRHRSRPPFMRGLQGLVSDAVGALTFASGRNRRFADDARRRRTTMEVVPVTIPTWCSAGERVASRRSRRHLQAIRQHDSCRCSDPGYQPRPDREGNSWLDPALQCWSAPNALPDAHRFPRLGESSERQRRQQAEPEEAA